jgi:hypothetical protein
VATVDKNFRVKNGLVVEGSTATVNGNDILTTASSTTNLPEGTNLYFTDERAQDAVGNAVGTGLTYNDTTGAISVTANTYEAYGEVSTHAALTSTHGVTGNIVGTSDSQTLTNKTIDGSSNTLSNIANASLTNSAITINGTSVSLGGTRTLGTDDVSEGSTNKYFTDERAQDAAASMITGGTHTNISVTYDDNAGTLSFNATGGVGSLSGTANEVEVSSVGNAYTVGLPDDVIVGNNLTVSGNLTVNGTTTTINSTTVSVDDKNIELAATASPTDASADGAGITVKGTTDHTFNWINATDAWTSSEHMNLASGKEYKIDGTAIKSVTETLTNKTISLTNNTVSGTLAEFNTAVTDADFASLAGTETLTNKTIDGSSNTLSNIGNGSLSNSSVTINSNSLSLGGSLTLDTDDISEGLTNVYFTDARAVTALEAVVPDFTAVEVNNIAKHVAATVSLANTTQTTAYSWAKADYRAAKFLVKFAYGTHTEVSEVLLTLDTSDNVGITEYAIVSTNGSLGDVTADVSGSDVRLRVTAGTATTTCHVVGTLIK